MSGNFFEVISINYLYLVAFRKCKEDCNILIVTLLHVSCNKRTEIARLLIRSRLKLFMRSVQVSMRLLQA